MKALWGPSVSVDWALLNSQGCLWGREETKSKAGQWVLPGTSLPFSGVASVSLTSPLSIGQVSRLESFWALRVVCPEQLTTLLAWIREPWEQLFSIGLRTVTQEVLDLDR